MDELIYLDYNATTPVLPEVLEAMVPWLSNKFGIPLLPMRVVGKQPKPSSERERSQR